MHFSPLPYLDPGSGSILIQLLIAVLLGAAIAIRASWSRIKGWFGIKPKTEEYDAADDVSEVHTVSSPSKISVILPTNCHSCGVTIRSNEIKWLDDLTAQCNYCGTSIRATKEN